MAVAKSRSLALSHHLIITKGEAMLVVGEVVRADMGNLKRKNKREREFALLLRDLASVNRKSLNLTLMVAVIRMKIIDYCKRGNLLLILSMGAKMPIICQIRSE
jgi:hypothetical protein